MPSYFHKNCLQWEFCTLKTNFSHLFFPVDLTWKRETIGKDLIFPVFEKWKRKTRRPYFLKTFVQSPSYFPKNRLLWKFCALKTYDGHRLLPPDTLNALPTCITCLLCPNMTQNLSNVISDLSDMNILDTNMYSNTPIQLNQIQIPFFWYMEFICSWYTSVHPKHQLENDFRWSWV